MSRKTTVIVLINMLFVAIGLKSQGNEVGQVSGSLDLNANVFIKDSTINAFNIPQYEKQFFGGESWLNLRYARGSFNAGLRYDFFLNSNIPNPTASFTDRGIGRWYVQKKFDKIEINAGYLYDQIGSGIIYRAYESRPLFIDNALLGASLKLNPLENLSIKAFAGQQKNAFDLFSGSIQGINVEYSTNIGSEKSPLSITPGVGLVHKTLGDESMDKIVSALQNYLPQDRFGPLFNSYAFTFYNNLAYKNITWYAEAALKTKDIYFNPFADKLEPNGSFTRGKFSNTNGSVLYTSVSYAGNNFGLTANLKRTENFAFRIDPNQRLLRGYITYLPPMNKINTYRLTARYAPFTQEVSEQAVQLDYKHRWNKKLNTNLNFSYISTLDNKKLYREFYFDANWKPNKSWIIIGGLQQVQYNQEVYEEKPEVPLVNTYVPFLDVLYKINRHNSIRFENQYMRTKEDFGSWVNSLIEYSTGDWIFETSIMYNIDPQKKLIGADKPEKLAYPVIGATYITGPNRLQLRYVKQVEGIVCSGGICRLEPAFSGVRFNLSTQF